MRRHPHVAGAGQALRRTHRLRRTRSRDGLITGPAADAALSGAAHPGRPQFIPARSARSTGPSYTRAKPAQTNNQARHRRPQQESRRRPPFPVAGGTPRRQRPASLSQANKPCFGPSGPSSGQPSSRAPGGVPPHAPSQTPKGAQPCGATQHAPSQSHSAASRHTLAGCTRTAPCVTRASHGAAPAPMTQPQTAPRSRPRLPHATRHTRHWWRGGRCHRHSSHRPPPVASVAANVTLRVPTLRHSHQKTCPIILVKSPSHVPLSRPPLTSPVSRIARAPRRRDWYHSSHVSLSLAPPPPPPGLCGPSRGRDGAVDAIGCDE